MARPVATMSPSSSATSRIQGTSSRRATPAARRARRAATVSASSGRARLWTRTMASRSESTAARISGRRRSGEDKGPDRVEGRVELRPYQTLLDRGGDGRSQLQDRPVPEDGPRPLSANENAVVVDDGRCAATPHHHTDARHPRHLLPGQAQLNVLPQPVQHGDRGQVVGGEALQVLPHPVGPTAVEGDPLKGDPLHDAFGVGESGPPVEHEPVPVALRAPDEDQGPADQEERQPAAAHVTLRAAATAGPAPPPPRARRWRRRPAGPGSPAGPGCPWWCRSACRPSRPSPGP